MKLSMNKVLGTIKKRQTFGSGSNDSVTEGGDNSPEAVATRTVKAFCASQGSQTGDEVTLLPPIVESAESSPAAAAECARLVRKYLHRDYWSKPSYQYNAIMLMRILSDNPGPTFTRNFDKKFVDVTKDLLRTGRDPNVRQMLMETLDTYETSKAHDEGLAEIIQMWKKEKEKANKAYGGPVYASQPQANMNSPHGGPPPPGGYPGYQQQQPYGYPVTQPQEAGYFSRAHRNRNSLPAPVELANRLEEARTSAKLLEQVVTCTPPAEALHNDLIKEFADRCLSASRSIQGYMVADDPAPDNDTMESLIDVNEQLQSALSQHQRAMLQARKMIEGDSPGGGRTSSAAAGESRGRRSEGWETMQAGGSGSSRAGGKGKGTAEASGSGSGSGSGGWGDSVMAAVAGPSRSNAGTPSQHQTYEPPSHPPPGASSRLGHTNVSDDEDDDGADPFRDPTPGRRPRSPSASSSSNGGGKRKEGAEISLPYEPFHPGFGGSGSSAAGAGGGSGSGTGQNFSSYGQGEWRKHNEGSSGRKEVDPVTPVTDDGYEDSNKDYGKREHVYRY